MGADWNPNQALSVELVKAVLAWFEKKIEGTNGAVELNRWVVAHTYVVVGYVISLRGPEGFLLDLDGLNYYWSKNHKNKGFFHICLRGKVKGEVDARCHIVPSVNVTSSGIKVKGSIHRLLTLKRLQGFTEGPAVSNPFGRLFSTQAVNDCFLEALESIFETHPILFSPRISSLGDVRGGFHIFRSLRISSDSRALEMRVGSTDIDIVNRWTEVEKSAGCRPTRDMKHHYADVALLRKPFLRYTGAM